MKIDSCLRICFPSAAIAAILLTSSSAWPQNLPSFNGATGYGGVFAPTTADPMPAGGWLSNATVYHVTTTADTLDASGKPLQGTLRGAFYDYSGSGEPKEQISNEVVVFDVGGVFNLTNGELAIKQVNNIYIAGQTAPSPVIVYGDTTEITHSTGSTKQNNNVILRYMTFRRGSATIGNDDSLDFAGGGDSAQTDPSLVSTNMIVDHVSTSWSTDEDLSLDDGNTDVTVQYSIMADSLRSDHAYGSLVRARINSNVTYSNNLYANNLSRNPRPGSYNNQTMNFDFRNNVIYNWANRAGYTGGASDSGDPTENVNMNYVGNYLVAGPSTPTGSTSSTAFTLDTSGNDPVNLHVYQSNNAIDSDHGTNPGGVPNGSDTGWAMFAQTNGTTTTAFPAASQWTSPIGTGSNTGAPANTVAAPSMATMTAANAYNQLILKNGTGYVGNFWWSRDPIDSRIINNVINGTNPPQGVAAAAPDPTELSNLLATPTTTRPAGWDTDGDGMPDIWEKSMGLNPNSAADATQDVNGSGYVNLQQYLDEIGAFAAPGVITFTGSSGGNYASILNWHVASTDSSGVNWQPTRLDAAQINSGIVVSNQVGMHAGVLTIANGASDTAQLNVSGGWLQVDNQLNIGGTDTSHATLNLSAGDLTAPILSKGAASTFNFTGGTLHAGIVTFNLLNQGGTLAPGYRTNAVTIVNATPVALSSIGATHVMGNLTLQSGSVQIEMASASSYDQVAVDGLLSFGGALQVSLLGGYVPTADTKFNILDWGSSTGKFASLSLPALGGSLVWSTTQLYTSGALVVASLNALPGDFSRDHHVDASDVLAMEAALANPAAFQAANSSLSPADLLAIEDVNGDGKFTNADLQTLENDLHSGGGSIDIVPEPGSLELLALAAVTVMLARCRRLAPVGAL
ncbi:MAG TPA: dockerin type I domain-containing protein [Pirellulales bacterium]|nr:dockerin type I domain-containing protein [Pirellulales bacterium]